MAGNPPSGDDLVVHRRRSVHLRRFDYRTSGAYFVTLCTAQRTMLFGEVAGDEVHLTQAGLLVQDCWTWLAERYLYVTLDAWVLMPNHLHGVVVICEPPSPVGAVREPPPGTSGAILRPQEPGAPVDRSASRKPLGRLIGAFKTVSTRRVNELRGTPGAVVWQRDYYEHIVRNESELDSIRQYIEDNPRRWALDRENPYRVG